jgi:2-dehydropantoate 2-reductase
MTTSATIRHDIWYKLWGNLTMNPVSAITGATGDRMLDDPLVRDFCSAAMLEASAIGAKIGCAIDQDPEARHAVTRELGAFKTSMLVDAERGKPNVPSAVVTAVHERTADRRRRPTSTLCSGSHASLPDRAGCSRSLAPGARTPLPSRPDASTSNAPIFQ